MGREAFQLVPSLCNTGGGGPKDVSGRNRVFCRGSLSRKGPPSAEGLSCLSPVSLHCLSQSDSGLWLRTLCTESL